MEVIDAFLQNVLARKPQCVLSVEQCPWVAPNVEYSFIASPSAHPFSRNLDRATFSLDISRIYASLRSIRSTTKRVMFSITRKQSAVDPYQVSDEALFLMKVFEEDGVLDIQRQVTLDLTLNQSIYFRQTAKLSEDNEIFMELQQSYLKRVAQFRNCLVQMKFHNDHISIESGIGQQDFVVQINKTVCKHYNHEKLLQNYENRNRLLVPPNFLSAQIFLANKLNQAVQMYIGDELMQGGRTMVYLVVAGDSFQIVSAFATVLDFDNSGNEHQQLQKQIFEQNSTRSDNQLHTNGPRHSLMTYDQSSARSGFNDGQNSYQLPIPKQVIPNKPTGVIQAPVQRNKQIQPIEEEIPPQKSIKPKPRLIPNNRQQITLKSQNILKTQKSISSQGESKQQIIHYDSLKGKGNLQKDIEIEKSLSQQNKGDGSQMEPECVHAQVVHSNTSSQDQGSKNQQTNQNSFSQVNQQAASTEVFERRGRPAIIEIRDEENRQLSDEKRRQPSAQGQSSSNQMSPLVQKLVSNHSEKSSQRLEGQRSGNLGRIASPSATNNSASPQYSLVSQAVSKAQMQTEASGSSYQEQNYRSGGKKDFLEINNILQQEGELQPMFGTESKLLRKNREHMEMAQSEVNSKQGSVERGNKPNRDKDTDLGFFKSPAPVKKPKLQQLQEESNQIKLISQPSSHSSSYIGKDSNNRSVASGSARGGLITATTGIVEGFGASQNQKRNLTKELSIKEKSVRRGFFNVGLFPMLKSFESYYPDNKTVSQKSFDDNPLLTNVAGMKSPDNFGISPQQIMVKKEQKQASVHLKKSLLFDAADHIPVPRLGARNDPYFEEYERNQNYGKLEENPVGAKASRFEGFQGAEKREIKRNNSFDNFLRQNRVKEEFSVFQLNHLADNNSKVPLSQKLGQDPKVRLFS